ncbi:MAG: RES family NAD+ phosphorylase [Gammaproteobacteria bacterium]|nr:RES family NAD+ phosphorylase [Gammaproteobacteria bacterium]
MSSNIWTRCAASSRVAQLSAQSWRSVEAQHQISTRRLVDSAEEHEVLEELLEQYKPTILADAAKLHYLLATPFRYPPLRHGSRFGSRFERGIWYGAEDLKTTFAEVAYYRLLFNHGSDADLGLLQVQLSVFKASILTPKGLDFTRRVFKNIWDTISSKHDYTQTQALGKDMRENNVAVFRYYSARSLDKGKCVGVIQPSAFKSKKPSTASTWFCSADRNQVDFKRSSVFGKDETFAYPINQFTVDGHLPNPAI